MPEQRPEDRKERVDRELIELLNELRVAIPGVQVLFAFLLTVPFNRRFGDTDSFQHSVYLVALLASALSSALLMATAAQHRLLFREPRKEQLLLRGNRLAIGGFVALAFAISASLLLVIDFVFGTVPAAVLTAVAAGVFAWTWWLLPLSLHERTSASDSGHRADPLR